MTSTKENNFGLDEQEFDQLAEGLRNDDSSLFEQVFLSHFESSMTYLQRKYGASHNESYDASMDALIDFRSRIIDGKVYHGNLRFLFTKMAVQHLLRERKKYSSRDVEETDITEEKVLDEEDLEKLTIAWSRLGTECQSILKLNFYCNMKLNEIAQVKKRNAPAVRKQKERCLNKLIEYFFNL